jgi:hypothetical protein
MRTETTPIAVLAVLLLVSALLDGCASTTLVNQWKSTEFAGAPLRKVMVVAVSTQASVRRVFEDEFASRLKAAGVVAVPSYTVIAEDGRAEQAVLEKAVQDLGADGVLVTRLVDTRQRRGRGRRSPRVSTTRRRRSASTAGIPPPGWDTTSRPPSTSTRW